MSRYSKNQQQGSTDNYWRATQAYRLATITLVLGFVLGYLFRGSGTPTPANSISTSSQLVSSSSLSPMSPLQSGPTLAENAVEPLLEQVKARPNDPELLAQIGNQYYDNHSYPRAIEYYRKSLSIRPTNVNVRTDMGTAMWYSGDADGAIREFEKSLTYQPNHAQTLFNLGVVKWQGKHDPQGALAVWRNLLTANPGYSERQKLEQMIQQVQAEIR